MNDKTTSYEPSGSQIRPWVRWAARIFDINVFSFLLGIILELTRPQALNIPARALNILIIVTYIFVEPIMLCFWGTTPGKALFKIRLRKQNGAKISYPEALSRSASVAAQGLALGIPIISLFTLLYSYNHLTKDGITPWDRSGNFAVSHQVLGLLRIVVIVLLFLVIIALILLPILMGNNL